MDQQTNDFLLKGLLRAVYWFDEGLQDHLVAEGWPRVSRTKSLILINVADGVTRPIQIAANLGMTRQAVHLALEELRTQGLVVIEPDPNDKRAKRVRFSPDKEGDPMRNAAQESLRRIESELAQRLGPDQFENLKRAMNSDWGDPIRPEDSPK